MSVCFALHEWSPQGFLAEKWKYQYILPEKLFNKSLKKVILRAGCMKQSSNNLETIFPATKGKQNWNQQTGWNWEMKVTKLYLKL